MWQQWGWGNMLQASKTKKPFMLLLGDVCLAGMGNVASSTVADAERVKQIEDWVTWAMKILLPLFPVQKMS